MRSVLGILSTVLFAAAPFPALANLVNPQPPPGGGVISICPQPSVPWCTDRASPTNAGCWQTNASKCAQLVRDAYQQSYNNLTATPTPAGAAPHGMFSTVLPESMSRGGALGSGAHEFYDQRKINQIDHDYGYLTTIRQSQRVTRFGNFSLLGTIATTAPLHPDWESRNEVDSCAEYVYKRYHDYSRFDDAAASCKNDYACVVNLAMSTTSPGINFSPLRKQDPAHDAMDVQLQVSEPAYQQPKNGFFAFAEDPGDNEGVVTPAYFSMLMTIRGNATARNTAEGVGTLTAAPYHVTNRWAWHVQMYQSQKAENLTAQEYADMEARQARVLAAMQQFRDLRAELVSVGRSVDVYAIMHPNTSTCGDIDIIPGGGLNAPPSTWGDGPPPPELINGSGTGTCKHPKPAGPPMFPPDSLQDRFQSAANQITDLLIAEWNHASPKNGALIDHGCLELSSTRCDWSPKQFALFYQHRFEHDREKDFQYCIDASNDNFTAQNYPSVLPQDHADLPSWEKWMVDSTRIRGDLIKLLPTVRNSDGSQTIGRNFPGGKVIGDKDFAAVTYAYDANYSVTFNRAPPASKGQPATICSARGSVHGDLSASLDLPPVPGLSPGHVNVIDAVLNARAGQNGTAGQSNAYASGHLLLFDKQIFSQDKEVDMGQFNIAPPSRTDLAKGWGTDIFVPIAGIIPLTIHIGVDFSAGFRWYVIGNAPQDCKPDSPIFALTGQIEPSVSANATLSAAIGISLFGLGAEAGLRGDLTLLQVSAPVDVTLGVGASQNDDGVIRTSLLLDTNASLELTSLQGSVSAFAEICFLACLSVEKELFSWPGVHLGGVPLFNLKKSFPLIAIDGLAL